MNVKVKSGPVLSAILIAILTFSFTTAAVASDTSLVGYWQFDEGSGTTATDSSGNGNNGTINGATWVDGKLGKALSFDGIDDYVLASPISLPKFTITLWTKRNGTQTDNTNIFTDIYNPPAPKVNYQIAFLGNNLVGGIYNSGWTYTPGVTLQSDVWKYVVLTYDGANLILYIDGVIGSSAPLVTTPSSGNSGIRIGRRADGTADYYKGCIDEVAIYNRALSADEIKAHYEGGITPPYQPITGNPEVDAAMCVIDNKYTDPETGLATHGTYVSAVTNKVVEMRQAGKLTKDQGGAIVKKAAQSSVNMP